MSIANIPTTPDDLIDQDHGRNYWNGANADIDSMLGDLPTSGGYSFVAKADVLGSRAFLAKLGIGVKNGRHAVVDTLEGGAGIGRVTEGLLLGISKNVDVIEPVVKFTAALHGKPGVRHIFNVGLEDWVPIEGVQYDLIWIQWCLGYLTDQQLVGYLELCKTTLNSGSGLIVVKENLSTSNFDMFDSLDSSVTREDRKFRTLFKQAGLRIVRTEQQRGPPNLPRKLLPVRIYALKPCTSPP